MLTKVDPSTMKRTRPESNPYEVWVAGGWTWRVLKKYTKNEDEYARAYCAVTSPLIDYTELGDVFVHDYERIARLVEVNP